MEMQNRRERGGSARGGREDIALTLSSLVLIV
jgi:hypothetical protein